MNKKQMRITEGTVLRSRKFTSRQAAALVLVMVAGWFAYSLLIWLFGASGASRVMWLVLLCAIWFKK